jgi:cytosine permease
VAGGPGDGGFGGSADAGVVARDELTPIPPDERVSWRVPALIFGGLEFTIPVLMAGAALADDFGLASILAILAVALAVQWAGNALQGYMGAASGLSSTFLARRSFGVEQSRFVVAPLLALLSMGWWAVQTAVVGNAVSVMLGIDYRTERLAWGLITAAAGILFAVPSVLGYQSMKWTDYFAVPAGLLLIVTGIYFALERGGLEGLAAWDPEGSLSFLEGVSVVIGVNAAQWVIASDYTRYARPTVKDQLKIPLGIVGVGLPLFFAGAVMAVGVGSADIVLVMQGLGVPVWGFLILWFATWTSQLVNNYTMGLALANSAGATTDRARKMLTVVGTAAALGVALAGIVDHFVEFLMAVAIVYPAIGGVMFADFLLRRRSGDGEGAPGRAAEAVPGDGDGLASPGSWDLRATAALAVGVGVGWLTQFRHPVGVPPIQVLLAAALCYAALPGRARATTGDPGGPTPGPTGPPARDDESTERSPDGRRA